MMTEEGVVTNITTSFVDTSGLTLVERFNAISWISQDPLYGLIRTEYAKKTRLQKEIVGSGAVWLGELCFFGDFKVIPNVYRYRRRNRAPEKFEQQLKRYYQTLFSKKYKVFFPWIKLFVAYLGAVRRNKVGFRTKLRLIMSVFYNMFLRYGFLMFKL